jgi:hypothetical protein
MTSDHPPLSRLRSTQSPQSKASPPHPTQKRAPPTPPWNRVDRSQVYIRPVPKLFSRHPLLYISVGRTELLWSTYEAWWQLWCAGFGSNFFSFQGERGSVSLLFRMFFNRKFRIHFFAFQIFFFALFRLRIFLSLRYFSFRFVSLPYFSFRFVVCFRIFLFALVRFDIFLLASVFLFRFQQKEIVFPSFRFRTLFSLIFALFLSLRFFRFVSLRLFRFVSLRFASIPFCLASKRNK